jgi:thioesterase domain-containing protein
VSLLALMDTGAPEILNQNFQATTDDTLLLAIVAREMLGAASPDLGAVHATLKPLPFDEQVTYVAGEIKKHGTVPDLGASQVRRLVEIFRSRLTMIRDYKPARYDGPILLLRAEASATELAELERLDAKMRAAEEVLSPVRRAPSGADLVAGWQALSTTLVRVEDIEGSHATLILEPHVRTLAARLRAALLDADSAPQSLTGS